MRVLLKRGVVGLGSAGAVVEVSEGYARNYLLPRGLAVAATLQSEQAAQRQLARQRQLEEQRRLREQNLADRLRGERVVIRARATVTGTLYEGLHPSTIAGHLARVYGISLSQENLTLARPIKRTGTYTVGVRLSGSRRVELELLVRPA